MLLKYNLRFSQARSGFGMLSGGEKKKKGNVETLLWPGVFCQVEILKIFSLQSSADLGNI